MPNIPQLPSAPIDPLADPHRLMAWPSVLHVTGKTRAEVYAMMADGKFPKPLLSQRRGALWLAADIGLWALEPPAP